MSSSAAYDIFRYQIIPPVFLVFFTVITQVLVVLGNPKVEFSVYDALTSFGNPFAWKVVFSFYTWALLSQKVGQAVGQSFQGPAAPISGYVPIYAANGFIYYWITLATFCLLAFQLIPNLCLDIYDNFGPIVQVLNVSALLFCLYLMVKGVLLPETGLDPLQKWDGKPWPYIFYRGVELHPRIFDADVKQVFNFLYLTF